MKTCIEFSNTISLCQVWHNHWRTAGLLSNLPCIKSAHIHINSLSQSYIVKLSMKSYNSGTSLLMETPGFSEIICHKEQMNYLCQKFRKRLKKHLNFSICPNYLVNLVQCPQSFPRFCFLFLDIQLGLTMEVLPYRENKARTCIIKQTNKCQRLLHKKIGNLACLFLEFKAKLKSY